MNDNDNEKILATVWINKSDKDKIIKEGVLSLSALINRSMKIWLSGHDEFRLLISECTTTNEKRGRSGRK